MDTQLEMFSLTPQEILHKRVDKIEDLEIRLRKRHFAADAELRQAILELRTKVDTLEEKLSKGA